MPGDVVVGEVPSSGEDEGPRGSSRVSGLVLRERSVNEKFCLD